MYQLILLHKDDSYASVSLCVLLQVSFPPCIRQTEISQHAAFLILCTLAVFSTTCVNFDLNTLKWVLVYLYPVGETSLAELVPSYM